MNEGRRFNDINFCINDNRFIKKNDFKMAQMNLRRLFSNSMSSINTILLKYHQLNFQVSKSLQLKLNIQIV